MRQLQSSSALFKATDDRTLTLIWTEDSQIFRAEIPNGSLLGLDDQVLNTAVGERIPDNHLYPPWSDGITEFQQPLSADVYVKKHYSALTAYGGTPYAAELVMAEVNVFERISKNFPHPNIIKYLGCIRNGDLLGGLCLQRCVCTLQDLVKGKVPADRAPPFQPNILISGIKAAIDHIHSLNLVHDDINPRNIMLDSSGNPILIDFDTCVAVGSPSRGGTPGWSKNPKLAAFQNDTHGFELVTKFVLGDYDGQDVDAHFNADGDTGSPK